LKFFFIIEFVIESVPLKNEEFTVSGN